jgi:hypothetical protein
MNVCKTRYIGKVLQVNADFSKLHAFVSVLVLL